MNFLLKVNSQKKNSVDVTNAIIDLLNKNNHRYLICEEDEICLLYNRDKVVSVTEGLIWCDIVITIGGDGTLLSIGTQAASYKKPVLGINTGRIGFLTALDGENIHLINNITDESIFTLKKHYFIKARVNKSKWKYCLNDVVISKSTYSNTVDLSIFSNGNLISDFAGDGIIFATSTGSTAYSLSVGGPIVDSDLQAMVISPVAPHTLSRASMVLAKDKHIKVIAEDRNYNNAFIAFDGADYQDICKDDIVDISLSSRYVSIYALCHRGQFQKVDKKLKSR